MNEEYNQEKLREAVIQHMRFMKRLAGGRRFNVSFDSISRLDLSTADLREAVFTGTSAVGTRFRKTILTSADMFGIDLSGADLRGAEMTRGDLRGAKLRGANLEDALLVQADIRGGFIIRAGKDGKLDFSNRSSDATVIQDAKLAGADLQQAKLGRIFGPRTDMSNANFKNASLRNANLSQSDMRGTNLMGADLTKADLSHCVLHGAVLIGSVLQGCILEGADLTGAQLNGADFDGVNLANVRLPISLDSLDKSLQQILLEHLKWISTSGAVGAQANLECVDLTKQNLPGVNLSASQLGLSLFVGANLKEALLGMADITRANMSDAKLFDTKLRGVKGDEAVFTRSDLRKADFSAMPLTGTQRDWPARLRGGNFTGADCREANFESAILTDANFFGADLRGANLKGAVLIDATLDSADLRGANTDGMDVRGARGLE